MSDPISRRKEEHLELARSISELNDGAAGWSDINLVHQALPSIDADDIDLRSQLLGHDVRLPLLIVGMTGGHPAAQEINGALARAAEKAGIAIGVGSQRAVLEHPELRSSYAVIREEAPSAFVMGNIGVSQLIDQIDRPALNEEQVATIIDMVRADALAVHLNFLEEVVQPEGQTRARGSLEALARLVAMSPVPVVVKETGGGISSEVAQLLRGVGVSAIDVGGRGGTSFAAIEAERSRARGDLARTALGAALSTWGIPTAVSVLSCASVLPTIAVGGVRSGVDAAKAFALGAVIAGVGRPLLLCALEGEDSVLDWIDNFAIQLRSTMFLAGAHDIAGMTNARRVILGATGEWIRQLDLV